uniref:wall-associated receptor kinase-like 1 n=1 Tax=Erigeron canadensis TaxID=72917 RepID=UPI001CB9D419|nr:wall-associated receptor kinase-like 1 [Erigeron canadensis]
MKLLHQAYRLLVIILSLVTGTSKAARNYAKPGCNDMCGNVMIPYPFGIGSNCAVNEWYNVDCVISERPYLSEFNNLEVLNINLEQQTVTVNASVTSDCQNPVRDSNQILNVDLDNSPFLFSRSRNKFVVEGCGNAVILDNNRRLILTGCSNTCRNDTSSDKNKCIGIGCCEMTLPYYLKSYSVNLTALESLGRQNGACGSVYLVDEESYLGHGSSYVPLSLLWTLVERDMNQISCKSLRPSRLKVDLGNRTSMESWKCNIRYGNSSSNENPYLLFDEEKDECVRCRDSGGRCVYDTEYVDGIAYNRNFTCKYDPRNPDNYKTKSAGSPLGFILGVSLSAGVIYFVAIGYAIYKLIMRTKDNRRRKLFFKRNGGLLLKQQEEADPSAIDKIIFFTSRELEKATNNFNVNRILGRGGQGTVYKGMLADGRIVVVKKSKIVDERRLEQFINELVILSQVNHRNVVKLLGCCLETEVPLIVSEFISNKTLYDHIHFEPDEFQLSWKMRLQIATEAAGALAYLHSATSIPIYHRDIKTTNILLDDKYRAKVSDFGISTFTSIDQTHMTTLVKGTCGYLDPEYSQSSQFTQKSDVYSFGVVLVELLTGERPISVIRFGGNRSLAMHFVLAMEEGLAMSIFDLMVIKEATKDELQAVANLAMRCLKMNGKNRPTMKEVATELETIRTSHIPSIL